MIPIYCTKNILLINGSFRRRYAVYPKITLRILRNNKNDAGTCTGELEENILIPNPSISFSGKKKKAFIICIELWRLCHFMRIRSKYFNNLPLKWCLVCGRSGKVRSVVNKEHERDDKSIDYITWLV